MNNIFRTAGLFRDFHSLLIKIITEIAENSTRDLSFMLPDIVVNPDDGRVITENAIVTDKHLIVAGADGHIRMWRLGHFLFDRELRGHEKEVTALAVNNKYLFSGSRDGTIIAWNRDDFIAELKFRGFASALHQIKCNNSYLVYNTLVFGTNGLVDLASNERISWIWEAKKHYCVNS